MISVFYQILLFLEEYILLDRFELGGDILDQLGVDAKISRCRSDGDLILDGSHEFRVGLLSIHGGFLC